MNEIKVSIIIPIYNVERYIERCARSLYEQTYPHIEYVWVNDATPDRSIDILRKVGKDYPNRKSQVHILSHTHNKGLPSARHTGLQVSTGDYVFHSDSDDWVEHSMIDELVTNVKSKNADIVWCDFYKSYSTHSVHVKQNFLQTHDECIRNLLCENMHGGYWNKLIRRSLYDENIITYSQGANMCEDLRGSIQLFYYARTVCYYPKAFYHYVQDNGGSLSANISSERHASAFVNIKCILTFLREKRMIDQFENEIPFLKLLSKRPYLISTDIEMLKKWKNTYPESNHYILSYKSLPFSLRFLGWFISKDYWFVVSFLIGMKRLKRMIT